MIAMRKGRSRDDNTLTPESLTTSPFEPQPQKSFCDSTLYYGRVDDGERLFEATTASRERENSIRHGGKLSEQTMNFRKESTDDPEGVIKNDEGVPTPVYTTSIVIRSHNPTPSRYHHLYHLNANYPPHTLTHSKTPHIRHFTETLTLNKPSYRHHPSQQPPPPPFLPLLSLQPPPQEFHNSSSSDPKISSNHPSLCQTPRPPHSPPALH